MSCSYYQFRSNDYYCMKKGDYVNSDTYYKYCKNYDYSYCPIYKDESGSGGCYITSACVAALNCPDNGEELSLLRNFRDTYVKKLTDGEKVINEYYNTAPKIVDKIDALENNKEIYKTIYVEMIQPCIDFINNGVLGKAYNTYKEYVKKLQRMYLD